MEQQADQANRTSIVHGGKPVYGACVGILLLDTRFPRIPGDIGNMTTWPFPVMTKVVRGATPRAVNIAKDENVIDLFIEAGRELVAAGADGLTTSCGFLSTYQSRLSEACGVPVAASSMMQVPFVQSLLPPGKRVGIITASSQILTLEHLRAAGAPDDTPVAGFPEGGELLSISDRADNSLDIALLRAEAVETALRLRRDHGDLGAIVLECTNLVPYARAIQHAVALPVFSIYSLVTWFHMGLMPRRFETPFTHVR